MAEPTAAPGQLRVDVGRINGRRIVALRGDIDMYSSAQLREELARLATEGADSVVLDLAGLDFLDSTGLGVLVRAQKELSQVGGELILRSPRPGARKVFEITGLDKIFTIEQ